MTFKTGTTIKLVALFVFLGTGTAGFLGCTSPRTNTHIEIQGTSWYINGEIVNKNSRAEGLLMNVRMVNTVFEDESRKIEEVMPHFDPDENTSRFIEKIPDYVKHGIDAFTVSLQGGLPGYEGAVNSAFTADGSLRNSYLDRVERTIRAADAEGAAIILTCFYQRQHSHGRALNGKSAIRNAVSNTARWISDRSFTNVLLEISNEYAHNGFRNWVDGEWLSSTDGQVELIQLAKETAPDLPVSTSGMGNGTIAEPIARAADFILIHFNHTDPADIPERITEARAHEKPVLSNEDNKVGKDGAEAAQLSVASGAGWGFMYMEKNQLAPFEYDGASDDPIVYRMIRDLTTPGADIDKPEEE